MGLRHGRRLLAALGTLAALSVLAVPGCGAPEQEAAPPAAEPAAEAAPEAPPEISAEERKRLFDEARAEAVSEIEAKIAEAFAEKDPTDPELQFFRGLALMHGTGGVEKDPTEANTWLRKAADQGHPRAQVTLGISYQRGRGGIEVDPEEALALFRKAAEKRHARALLELGIAYREGRSVPVDLVEALKWFMLSSRAGGLAAKPMSKGAAGLLDARGRQRALYLANEWERERGYLVRPAGD